jgi:glycine/D-amino acid oxidase-like deaminating enzyme
VASPAHRALFDADRIEEVFACHEVAFDHKILGRLVGERLAAAGIEVRLATAVVGVEDRREGVLVRLSDGSEVTARFAFNITYSQINAVLAKAGLPPARLKHEIAELALIEPPRELERIGVTVMDGPFFSAMPYPAERLYSLTHVRYTPHDSWADNAAARDPYDHFAALEPESRYAFMRRDAQAFLPCLAGAEYRRSIYEVKTVLIKNEGDDGRPILYHRSPDASRVISVLGGKIDNIYDLFEAVKDTGGEFAALDPSHVFGRVHA